MSAWAEARSIPVTETGCWLWLGAEKGNGYGNVRRGKSNQTAHRRSWEESYGPVSDGMDVCHKCDTRQCINPGHLFIGSRGANMRDAKAKGRLSTGRKHGRLICGEKAGAAKLSVSQVSAIRRASLAGAANKDLADLAGVSADNIRRIVRNETWKELELCAA